MGSDKLIYFLPLQQLNISLVLVLISVECEMRHSILQQHGLHVASFRFEPAALLEYGVSLLAMCLCKSNTHMQQGSKICSSSSTCSDTQCNESQKETWLTWPDLESLAFIVEREVEAGERRGVRKGVVLRFRSFRGLSACVRVCVFVRRRDGRRLWTMNGTQIET